MLSTSPALAPQHPSLDEAYPLHDIFRRHRDVEQQLAPILPSSLTEIIGDYTSERDCPVSREIKHMRAHQHEMSPWSVAFMERAYSLIARSNASHGPDAPAAIILQAVFDHNHLYSSMRNLPQFAQLVKTHYVVLQVIGSQGSLGTTLNEIHAQLGNRPIMTLIIIAHGTPTTLWFSNTNRYRIENVCADDFTSLHPSASIILNACNTGQQLAKCIASVQPRPVFANIDRVQDICLTPCCTTHGYGMVAFHSDNGNMVTRRLQQNDEVLPCSASIDNIAKIKNILLHNTMQGAQQGDFVAQGILGNYYNDGQGVTQSYEEAIAWFRRAAEQGDPNAQFGVGYLYERGQGVTQSYERAEMWYKKAAEQGIIKEVTQIQVFESTMQRAQQEDAIAQCNLGICYKNGQGVTQSYEEAIAWFRRAATQGLAEAQFNLGYCYEHGLGVTQSYSEAALWYNKAAQQGDVKAKNYFNVPLSTKLYRIGVRVLNTLRRFANL